MTKIKHIEFWVSNLNISIKFYDRLFKIINWKKIDENSFSNGITKIYFIQQPVIFTKNIGPRHICFLAESRNIIDKVAEFLKDNGFFIIRGPIDYKYKERISYTIDFKDPDGYILEIATESITI